MIAADGHENGGYRHRKFAASRSIMGRRQWTEVCQSRWWTGHDRPTRVTRALKTYRRFGRCWWTTPLIAVPSPPPPLPRWMYSGRDRRPLTNALATFFPALHFTAAPLHPLLESCFGFRVCLRNVRHGLIRSTRTAREDRRDRTRVRGNCHPAIFANLLWSTYNILRIEKSLSCGFRQNDVEVVCMAMWIWRIW